MNIKQIQAVFIDRDGTIGGADNIVYPGKFQLYPFVKDSLDLLKNSGVKIFSFTNQPGISRGEARVEDFERELEHFGFDEVYICPHQHGDGCSCRKPEPGMLLMAAKEYDLHLSKCVVIGDRWTDLVAAEAAGSMKILVKTGSGEKDLTQFLNHEFYGRWAEVHPDYIADDFNAAVNWLLNQ